MAPGAIHIKYYKFSIILAVPIGIALAIFIGMSMKFINEWMFILFYLINYALASSVEPDLDQLGLTSSEGRVMRGTKRITPLFGLVGALWVMWWFLYAFIISLVGGHRSVFSHGFILGTIGRIIWFNLPVLGIILFIKWVFGWTDWYYQVYGDLWVIPYLLSQFIAWGLADSVHLLLDTEWAKYKLYIPVPYKR